MVCILQLKFLTLQSTTLVSGPSNLNALLSETIITLIYFSMKSGVNCLNMPISGKELSVYYPEILFHLS